MQGSEMLYVLDSFWYVFLTTEGTKFFTKDTSHYDFPYALCVFLVSSVVNFFVWMF